MKRSRPTVTAQYIFTFALVTCVIFLVTCTTRRINKPSIDFSVVPPAAEGGPDTLEPVAGRVTGARAGQRIVLFAKAGIWWVQPTRAEPFTAIQPDSTFNSSIHLGTEYAALLVEPGYTPPQTTEVLPSEGGDVVAVKTVAGQKSEQSDPPKTIQFAGYGWQVRNVSSPRGGTNNAYSNANAWTDADGFLHLRIADNGGQWSSAEVKLSRSLGYGTYLFVVRDVSQLEPAAVLSIFTWDEADAGQNHREMNIELARWGDPASKNAQFVVQPYYVPANVVRFDVPAGALTHSLKWEAAQATFKTVRGRAATDSGLVAQHTFTTGVPAPGGESVHLDLYVFGSAKNPLQKPVEVVIEKFEFLP